MSEEKSKLIHLIGNKDDFKALGRGLPKSLEIVEVEPDFDLMMQWLKKVGGDSRWDKRKEYYGELAQQDMIKRINETSAHLWLLCRKGKEIGFTQTLEQMDLSEHFEGAKGIATHWYKFGLVPNERFKGTGAHFANATAKKIYEEADNIYFNTRDSNKVNSVDFWSKQGFNVVKVDEIEDDTIEP